MELDDFSTLKEKMEALKRKQDRAQGAMNQLLSQLEGTFYVKTIEEAEELLKTMNKEREEVEKEFTAASIDFEKKYGHLLEETDGDS